MPVSQPEAETSGVEIENNEYIKLLQEIQGCKNVKEGDISEWINFYKHDHGHKLISNETVEQGLQQPGQSSDDDEEEP